jgi:hypothetical protein
MKREIEKSLQQIKKALSRFNYLTDDTIRSFQEVLKQVQNISLLRDQGFGEYITIQTSSELENQVSLMAEDVIKGLQNVDIGDA